MLNGKTVTQSGAVLNPAIAIGTNFAMLFDKDGTMFQYVWIYALFPLAGSILAVIFHEFVFKKTQEVLHDDEGSDENDQLIEKWKNKQWLETRRWAAASVLSLIKLSY